MLYFKDCIALHFIELNCISMLFNKLEMYTVLMQQATTHCHKLIHTQLVACSKETTIKEKLTKYISFNYIFSLYISTGCTARNYLKKTYKVYIYLILRKNYIFNLYSFEFDQNYKMSDFIIFDIILKQMNIRFQNCLSRNPFLIKNYIP